jgi:hypothetical protein
MPERTAKYITAVAHFSLPTSWGSWELTPPNQDVMAFPRTMQIGIAWHEQNKLITVAVAIPPVGLIALGVLKKVCS